jgi:flagellin
MGISINTNVTATRASQFLASNHQNLQHSLDRLSSGRRITQPSDDAGGLAVSMKLEHTGKVLRGVGHNISNAISLLQVQDGALSSIGEIVGRIGELKGVYDDVTKNTADKATYDAELVQLTAQVTSICDSAKFNGVDVFGAASPEVFLDETGTNANSVLLSDTEIDAAGTALKTAIDKNSFGGGTALTTAEITAALEYIATQRATNGGEVNRLRFAQANVESQVTNLTAAHGRIMDVDIAAESSNLAKQQILVQASAAMTAQANMSNDVALMLLRQ